MSDTFIAAGFAALWRGRPVPVAELLSGGGALGAEIAAALVPQGRAEVDEHARLVGVHGLTLRPTRHHFVHDGRRHRTWCAFDTIGIPAALRLDATAYTDCPTCRRPITVEMVGGVPHDAEVALWLPASADGNLIANFCARADLYCSPAHLHQSIDALQTPGNVADLAIAASLGRDTWADVAGIDLDKASS